MTFIAPQLLTPARAAPEGDGWIHEVKYDGFRLLCDVQPGRVRLYTRRGNDWTSRLPGIAVAMGALDIRSAYLDGEITALAADGIPDFEGLPRAMRGARGSPRLVYHAFDLLALDGRDLTRLDVLARKRLLAAVLHEAPPCIRYTDHLRGDGPALWKHAHALGLEGIVSKRAGSGYHPGQRTRAWLKVKCYHRYTFTITAVHPDSVAVAADDGAPAGLVPVWSARTLAQVEPGMCVQVKALAWRPGRKLRHATLHPAGG